MHIYRRKLARMSDYTSKHVIEFMAHIQNEAVIVDCEDNTRTEEYDDSVFGEVAFDFKGKPSFEAAEKKIEAAMTAAGFQVLRVEIFGIKRQKIEQKGV